MSEIRLVKTGKPSCILAYEGHVDNVIKGHIPEELKNKRFSASSIRYGFELGSPQGIYNLGACFVLNDLIYSSRTDFTRKERSHLMWGPEFVTAGIFVVPREVEHTHIAYYADLDKSIPLRDVYRILFEKLDGPFAMVGCAELTSLKSKTITYSPIEEENIFEHAEKYYAEHTHVEENANIAFMGATSNMADEKLSSINEKLKSVLHYDHFHEQSDALITHTHALTLNKPVVNIEEVEPHHGEDVVHINDDSSVRYMKAYIFKISDIKVGF